jgi:hypothetical protein
MPFSNRNEIFYMKENIRYIGEAISDWKNSTYEFERVQGVLVDIKYLMHNYLKRNENYIVELTDLIQRAFEPT